MKARVHVDITPGTLHSGAGMRAERRMKLFLALTKPRVVSLIVFTAAVVGMFLAAP